MNIYNVGPEELTEDNFNNIEQEHYKWLVYHYDQSGYDGSGSAVALYDDGKIHAFNLGHCSCHGPLDSGGCLDIMTMEEFLKGPDNHFDDDYKNVKPKVKELLGVTT